MWVEEEKTLERPHCCLIALEGSLAQGEEPTLYIIVIAQGGVVSNVKRED